MSEENRRGKEFLKGDPGMSPAMIIFLVLAVLAVGGFFAYLLIAHGSSLSLPKVPK